MSRPPVFEGLNDIDAATARRRFKVREAGPGEVLVEQGSIGRTLAAVVAGELEIRAGGTVVGVAGPGSLLGETALFEDTERTATVVARTAVVLWVLERSGYEELRDTVHPICRNLEQAAIADQVARLHAVGDRVAELALGTPVAPPPTGFFAAVRRMFGGGGSRETSADRRAALARSPLFTDAPPQVLDAIAARFVSLSCSGGTFLCTEGEIGDRMFVLDRGEVDVIVAAGEEPLRVSTLEPGAAFGMVSLASGAPRMSSCVARDQAAVQVLERDAWDELVDEDTMIGSTFRRAVIRALAEQLRFTNGQLAEWASRADAASLAAARRDL